MKRIASLALLIVLSICSCQKDKKSLENFKSETDAAMNKMMADMDAVPMTMDPDVDFAKMMIPHHQGAIDMADAILNYSSHS